MKTLLAIILFAAVVALAAPKNIQISWDYADSDRTNCSGFNLYSSTNIAGVHTNWQLLTVITNIWATNVTISVEPQQMFFLMTATSAWWGVESIPSPEAATPPVPARGSNVTIKRVP